MHKKLITIGLSIGLATAAHAAVIIDEDFESYTNGDGLQTITDWSVATSPAAGLYTIAGGAISLDTGTAQRNYHAVNSNGFAMSSGDVAILSVEFRYTHTSGGDITTNFNKEAFGLLVSSTPNTTGGTVAKFTMTNRGGAIGTRLPISPWIEGWVPHTSVGVDTTAGGTSDWVRLVLTLTDNGTDIQAQGAVYNVGNNQLIYTGTAYSTGISSGSTIYAGLTTGYNDVGDVSIESFSKFSEVEFDNLQFESIDNAEVSLLIFK
ncbi:MAG: hypothetical protein AAFX93_16155 [Verrucomicrobiota bacterium]